MCFVFLYNCRASLQTDAFVVQILHGLVHTSSKEIEAIKQVEFSKSNGLAWRSVSPKFVESADTSVKLCKQKIPFQRCLRFCLDSEISKSQNEEIG